MTSRRSDAPSGLRVDVAVVGGGPTGLAAALLAARLGRSVALVAPPRPGDQRTSALFVGALDLLRQLGTWEQVAAGAAPLKAIRVVDATGRMARAPEVLFAASEIGLEAFGYNVPNAVLGEALASGLARHGVIGVPALAREIADRGETVGVATSGLTVQARLVVGADGRQSRVRRAAGIAVAERRYPQSGLVATLEHGEAHDEVSTEFHTAEGPLTLVPLPGRRSSLVWVAAPATIESAARLGDGELAEEIERRTGSFLGRIKVEGERQVYPIHGMRADRMAGHRIALVGEAGHALPPIGAQGLNLGLRDVAGLAAPFASADPGGPAALGDYDRQRRADVTLRASFVDGLNGSLISAAAPIHGLRSLGLSLLDRIGPLRRAAMRFGLGPAISELGTGRAERSGGGAGRGPA